MTRAVDAPSLVVGLDPSLWAGSIVSGLLAAEGRHEPRATLRSTAELQAFLSGSDSWPAGVYLTILVNVEEFTLHDLEEIRSQVTPTALVVVLHRDDLDPERTTWAMRTGGLTLRAGLTTEADVASLCRLAYGRAVRPAATASTLVFLCHSSEDRVEVTDLFGRLTQEGVPCWLDQDALIPGQRWEQEIRNALRRSSHAVVCLTRSTTEKRGFVQKELRWALEEASHQPESQIFVIPVRLEPCEIPEHLRDLQHVDLFQPDGFARLLSALRSPKVSTA